MAKRLKIGLIYSYNKEWIAGSYYILNLIHALNKQPDKQKPTLIILSHTQEEFEEIEKTGYPYLVFKKLNKEDLNVSYNLLERVLNKISRVLTKKNLITRTETNKRLKLTLDALFPSPDHIYFSKMKNKIFWIPDFQEHFLPEFFSENEITGRKKNQQFLSDKGFPIVFSSGNAKEHFNQIYPTSQSETFTIPFAVTHPMYEHLDLSKTLEKYNINSKYFFCPNQFWAHKNHLTVLEAVRSIKSIKKENVLVVFSGKENDYRNPDFFNGIKQFVHDHNLNDSIRFLGFIDREDQLLLMKNAICIIQPSLFEGWSTVVEDVKAIGQYVIASDLPVHKEQIKDNVTFFSPLDADALAATMIRFNQQTPEKKNIDYNSNVIRFGENFIRMINKLNPKK